MNVLCLWCPLTAYGPVVGDESIHLQKQVTAASFEMENL